MIYAPEGSRLHTPENQAALRSISAMEHAMHTGMILEARAVLCDSSHNLAVSLPCMRGIIPREEGAMGIAEGTTKDIALIARAGKPVCFRILRIEEDASGLPVAILSRRIVQEECWKQYLSHCTPGDILPAVVTHLEKFGAFVDIGCGIPSLLPIDTISVSRIAHPRDRFTVGQSIRVIVRQVEPGRIHLTHRELLGTWAENAAMFSAGQTVAGIIRSVESYGVFVELSPEPRRAGRTPRGRCRRNVRQRVHQSDPAGENESQAHSDRHIPAERTAAAAALFYSEEPESSAPVAVSAGAFATHHRNHF